MEMRKIYKRSIYLTLALIAMIVGGALLATPAQAAPPAQDPRPPFIPPGGDNGSGDSPGSSGGSRDDTPAAITCGSLSGEVLNWGFRPEPGILTQLASGSWEMSENTNSDGRYSFGSLGVGVASLNIPRAPGEVLRAWTSDAAVYLTCDYPTIANLALYSGDTIEPPATIKMSAESQVISWNRETEITLTVENTLPTAISNVIVTNLMPPGLKAVEVIAPSDDLQENMQIVDGGDDGQLVVAYLDTVPAQDEMSVVVVVTAIEDTPFVNPINTATLFYRESVADQTSLDLVISNDAAQAPVARSSDSTAVEPASQSEVDVLTGSEGVVRNGEADIEQAAQVEDKTLTEDDSTTGMTDAAESGPAESDSATTDEATEKTDGSFDPPSPGTLPQTGDDVPVEGTGVIIAGTVTEGQTGLVGSIFGMSLLLLGFAAYGVKSYRSRQY